MRPRHSRTVSLAKLVSIEPVGSACLRVDRTGGPTPDFVAAMLLHAIEGLPDARLHADSAPDGTNALHCEDLGGLITLRQSANPIDRELTTSGWAEFTKELAARRIGRRAPVN